MLYFRLFVSVFLYCCTLGLVSLIFPDIDLKASHFCHSLCFFFFKFVFCRHWIWSISFTSKLALLYPSWPPFYTMFLFQTRLKWESDYPDKRKTISPDFFLFVIFFLRPFWLSFLVFFFSTFVNNDFEALTKDGLYKEEDEDLARLFLFVNCAISKWAISLCMSAWGSYSSLPSPSSSSLSKLYVVAKQKNNLLEKYLMLCNAGFYIT